MDSLQPLGPRSPAAVFRPPAPPLPEAGAEALELSDGVTLSGGTIQGRVDEYSVSSPLVGEKKVWVYLPPGYAPENKKHYPVLYVMDGGSAFDQRTSVKTHAFGGQEFGLDEAVEKMAARGNPNTPIVVALESSSDNSLRAEQLSAYRDPQHGGGGGEATLKFLEKQLKPWVDAHFTTRPERSSTAIMGASLGGLFSLRAATQSATFGLVGALSPSLWFAQQAFFSEPTTQVPDRAWIDTGDREASPASRYSQDPLGELESLGRRLEEAGMERGGNLAVQVVEGGQHRMKSWQKQIEPLLEHLFPASQPSGTE